ncbi:hypothetical protein DPX16_12887 [Anabarilius grahami]|uniref:CUB domain-containing protein n=1 Tax=Anabarilius grahami TaxID=495550 RepID=A0A3N0XE21_ANAGA|nr:hypothetical protein DPX16_12887 [Anabarilius grahami]
MANCFETWHTIDRTPDGTLTRNLETEVQFSIHYTSEYHSTNKRCVWSVTPRDVWTDIRCNDELLLVDGGNPVISCAFSLAPFLHIAEIRLGSNQQPLNP